MVNELKSVLNIDYSESLKKLKEYRNELDKLKKEVKDFPAFGGKGGGGSSPGGGSRNNNNGPKPSENKAFKEYAQSLALAKSATLALGREKDGLIKKLQDEGRSVKEVEIITRKAAQASKSASVADQALTTATEKLNQAFKSGKIVFSEYQNGLFKIAAAKRDLDNRISEATAFRRLNTDLSKTSSLVGLISPQLASLIDRFDLIKSSIANISINKSLGSVANAQSLQSVRASLGGTEAGLAGLGQGSGLGSGALAAGILAAGAALGGLTIAAAKGVQAFAPLEQVLNRVRVFGQLNSEQFKTLTADVERLSVESGIFSQLEIAQSLEELLKSGVSASDGITLLKASMNSAIVSGESLTSVNSQILDSLFQFKLGFDQASRVGDVFAATANATKLNVSDIAESMRNAGSIANSYGVSIEETAAAIGVLGQNGLVGLRAGEQLKIVLRNLYAGTGQAREGLQALGVSAYDASGQARPLEAVLLDIQNKLKDLQPEQANFIASQIAGGEAAGSFANLVQSAGGQLAEFTKLNKDAQGASGALAAEINQGVVIAFKEFQVAGNSLFAKFGAWIAKSFELSDALRGLAALLNSISSFSLKPIQDNVNRQINSKASDTLKQLQEKGKIEIDNKGNISRKNKGFFGNSGLSDQELLVISRIEKAQKSLKNTKSTKLSDRDALQTFSAATGKKTGTNFTNRTDPPKRGGSGTNSDITDLMNRGNRGKKGPSQESLNRKADKTDDLTADLKRAQDAQIAKQKELEIDSKILDIRNKIKDLDNTTNEKQSAIAIREASLEQADQELANKKLLVEQQFNLGNLTKQQKIEQLSALDAQKIQNQYAKEQLAIDREKLEIQNKQKQLLEVQKVNKLELQKADNDIAAVNKEIQTLEAQKVKEANNQLKIQAEITKKEEERDGLISKRKQVLSENAQEEKNITSAIEQGNDALDAAIKKAKDKRDADTEANRIETETALKEPSQNLQDAIKEGGKTLVGEILGAFEDGGENAGQKILTALGNFGKKILDTALNNALNNLGSGASGGGIFSKLFGGFGGGSSSSSRSVSYAPTSGKFGSINTQLFSSLGSGGSSSGGGGFKGLLSKIPGIGKLFGGGGIEGGLSGMLGGAGGILAGLGIVAGIGTSIFKFFKNQKEKRKQRRIKKQQEKVEKELEAIDKVSKESDKQLENAIFQQGRVSNQYLANTAIGFTRQIKENKKVAASIRRSLASKKAALDRAQQLQNSLKKFKYQKEIKQQIKATEDTIDQLREQIDQLNKQGITGGDDLKRLQTELGKSIFDFNEEVTRSGFDSQFEGLGSAIAEIINGGFDKIEAGFNPAQVQTLVSNQLAKLQDEFIKPIDDAIADRLKDVTGSITDTLKDFGFQKELTADAKIQRLLADFRDESLKLEEQRTGAVNFINTEANRLLATNAARASAGGSEQFFINLANQQQINEQTATSLAASFQAAVQNNVMDVLNKINRKIS